VTDNHQPIAPYLAVGLSTVVHGVGERKHIKRNLAVVEDAIHAAMSVIGINMPVRLVALPEGALTGFTDEAFDIPHVTAARDLFIDVPGEETEVLAGLARHYDVYLVVQCKARWPEVIEDRYFNMLFVISPQGEIVHRAAKNHLWCRERSCTPHDVYDRWVEVFGDGIDAFYPVLRTDDIGNLGTICCSDGEYPEAVRALAMNGAEVVYRASYPHPATGNEIFEIQSRARALDNNMYIVAPNMGTYYLFPEETTPIDTFGGRSFVIDYKGRIVGRQDYGAGSTYVGGVIDIEALRDHRARAQWDNWMKDLRTELYQLLYEQPIYPKNLYLKRAPMKHAEYRNKVIKRQIRLMHDRDIWAKPDR
jgi:predicted amidohydrolase